MARVSIENNRKKALLCAQQLERIRDARSELCAQVEEFKMYCRLLERALPEAQRQPITALITDINGELSRINDVNFDDMHYPLNEIL